MALLTATFTDPSVVVTPDQRAELAALPQVDPYLVWAMLVSAFRSTVDPNANSPTRIAIVAELDEPTRLAQFGIPSFLMPAWAPELRIVPALLDWDGLLDLLGKPPQESGVKRFVLSLARGTRGEPTKRVDPQLGRTLLRFDRIPRPTANDPALSTWLDARQNNADIRAKLRGLGVDALSAEALKLEALRPLVCVVDDGCSFASGSMLAGAVSRIASIWHQGNDEETIKALDDAAGWRGALDINIGVGGNGLVRFDLAGGLDGRKLRIPGHVGGFRKAGPAKRSAAPGSEEALSLPEPAIYAASAYPSRLHRWTHGSAVLGLIAGDRPWGVGARDAKGRISWPVVPEDVCFVQLPDATVLDTSGGSLASHALDAIRHALAQALPGQQVIVNLSYGTHSGGHDATSIWDAGLEELLNAFDGIKPESQRKTLHVVLPAGNSHRWRAHAHKCLHGQGADNELLMKWKVQPDNPAESFLEIWLPPGTEFRIDVEAPDGTTIGARSPDRSSSAPTLIETSAADVPRYALIWPKVVPQSKRGTMALLAVAPTARWSDKGRWGNGITRQGFRTQLTAAPHGIWTVRITRIQGPGDQAVHAWVQRSDSAPGRPRRAGYGYPGRQSHLVEHTGHALAPEFTLNGLTSLSHPRLYVVGAMRRSDASLSDYSAAGPNRIDHARFEGPDRVVAADESPNVHGLLTQGFFGGGRVRLSGTSLAAAAFTRLLYEDLVAAPGRGPLNTAFLDKPSREPPVPAGNPARAEPVFRGVYRRILPDHPFGLLTRWPTRRP